VAGVHRLQHVHRLGAADLADDDPVGSHTQRVAHQLANRDLARPSMFFGRDSSRRTCAWLSRNSAASSIVTIRSVSGIAEDIAFSSVVLPEPVPPEIRMFSSALIAASRNSLAA
jgi:hypothetical protein